MKVGKRLWCSYRYGRSGCGATVRLYTAEIIHRHRYTATELTAFLVTLISSLSISTAYKAATNSDEPRNAYRLLGDFINGGLDNGCMMDDIAENQAYIAVKDDYVVGACFT